MKKRAMAKAEISQPESVTVDISSQGRDEMNLAEFPITVLADRVPKGTKTLIFRAGQGQLTITGSDAYGLPTALDADIIVALIQLTKLRNDFKGPKINFTRYELLRLLGWNNEGRNYRRLDESLRRWVGVTLHYDNCWWDNQSKRYGDATLHILESVIIIEGKARSDEDSDQAPLPLSTFIWNRVFLDSCQADNLKLLDVGLYFTLAHSASKRLYRFLDKRFYHRGSWVFDLAEIAFERVGLSRNYARNVAKIKEKLRSAIDELEVVGFLEPLAREDRFFKDEEGWKVRFDKHADRFAPPGPQDDAAPPPLVAELAARGVTRAKGMKLARAYPQERILEKIDIYDWMTEMRDGRIRKSPAGWLVKAIEDDYVAPKGFEPRVVREERLRAQHERDRAADDEARRRREDTRRRERERREVDAYLGKLGPSDRAALEAEALARSSDEVRRNYKSIELSSFRDAFMSGLLHEHLAGRLSKGELVLF